MTKKQAKSKKKSNKDIKIIREVQDALRSNAEILRSSRKLTANELKYVMTGLTESMLELWIRYEKIFLYFSPEEDGKTNPINKEIYI